MKTQIARAARLVYVDSSHLARLQSLREKKPSSFSELRRRWIAAGHTLALSFHHSQEIAQLETDDGIERRLAAVAGLGDFLMEFRGYSQVQELEIQAQLRALLTGTFADFSQVRSICFEHCELEALREAIAQSRRGFQDLRNTLEMGAAAENLFKPLRAMPRGTESDWMLDRKKRPPADYDWDAMKRRMLEHAGPESDAVRETMATIADMMIRAIQTEGTLHDALIAIYGLKDCEHLALFHEYDLPMLQGFFHEAREQSMALAPVWNIESGTLGALVPRLNPYAAPGFRLMLAVERARRSHPKQTEPGDFVDSDHLIYAPYVDALFVDKRTYEFLTQEARRDSARLPAAATTTIHTAADWGDILQALQST